jgi:hypothetical protein
MTWWTRLHVTVCVTVTIGSGSGYAVTGSHLAYDRHQFVCPGIGMNYSNITIIDRNTVQ